MPAHHFSCSRLQHKSLQPPSLHPPPLSKFHSPHPLPALTKTKVYAHFSRQVRTGRSNASVSISLPFSLPFFLSSKPSSSGSLCQRPSLPLPGWVCCLCTSVMLAIFRTSAAFFRLPRSTRLPTGCFYTRDVTRPRDSQPVKNEGHVSCFLFRDNTNERKKKRVLM